ncbi:protein SLOW GREEN 1, chloroplastic [Cynara cardunculus var. scolymus]|uniref:protein SLOW GREEN 1, chloroplastic n=1 Tax=Cynara cardunculus var. scolymus TaxID=59895 RepID=UPI000D62E930|nr:protein SLOW GREEN 1, chloroplastic [Cynara cardunculus var. scolymus]
MGSYINTLSLHSPLRLHIIPKSQTLLEQNSSLLLQNSLRFNSMLKISQKPTSILSYLKKPISYYPLITSSSSTQKGITNFVSEKIVVLLVGSFVFMGCFNKKPVLAQPTNETTESQISETQDSTFDEEEMMYMRLVEDNPKSIEALKSVFHLKMKRGKTKEAIGYVERLIDVEPKEVEWRLLQALCYEMIGEYSKAKSFFKKILKGRPLLLRALHGLAMLMHKNHEGPAVFEMLNKALEIAQQKEKVPEERNIRILIAQMHVVKGELDDALKLFKDLIDENPRDFRPYLCQGIIYSLLDRKDEAEEQFSTYQSLLPDEFPERGFLDDVVLAAKTEIRQKRKNELKPEFFNKK